MGEGVDPDSELFRYFPLLFVLFGLLFCWVGLRLALAGRRLRESGVRVPGVVVRNQWSSGDGTGGTFYPVMRFRTADGRDLEVRSEVGSNPAHVREGAQVTVVYDPAKPERARIDSMVGRGGAVGVLFVAVGAVVTVVAVIISVNVLV
ncbi:MAG: DUF3592 domain-containing protein [Streptosporangiales bacterium]|nr:DUF3592 domain-containing protein [Streptosporangiales bacterium]